MLLREVERTRDLLKTHEAEREITGCSIMNDGWTDKKRRSIMNLCLHCKLGTVFLESKEASAHACTSLYIFNYVDECIEKIGINLEPFIFSRSLLFKLSSCIDYCVLP